MVQDINKGTNMKPLKLILILSAVTVIFYSCKEKDISLIGLFWNPPSNIDVLYESGAKKGEMFNGNGYDQTAALNKPDTLLQFDYRDKKLFYVYLQFNTSKAKDVFDSLVMKHHLQSGNGLRPPDTTSAFIYYTLEDDKFFYRFTVKDTSIQVQSVCK
jgi:hypothetical protein